jgi:hypothetical protein
VKRTASLGLALFLSVAGAAGEPAEPDPLRAFLEDNPGTHGEELIDFALGDSVDRVLAVVHNPESGLTTRAVGILDVIGNAAVDRSLATLAGRSGAEARGSYLVLVTQDCDDRQAPPRMRPGGWLYLSANRLAAFDVVSYGPNCRVAEERFETSSHDAMRVVGERLYRPLGRGRFRYGALRYDSWDDAFAAPTREATLSLLRGHAAGAPDDPSVQNRFAVGLYASGDREGASQRLLRAEHLDPSAPDPHWNLAHVYRQRGDRAGAAREEALASPTSPPSVGGGS